MRCSFCGEPVIRATGETHHLTKRSKGGQDIAGNRVRICTRCHTLVHVTEGMYRKRIPRPDMEAYLYHYLSMLSGIDVDRAVGCLCDAGEQAATVEEGVERKFVPVTLKVPVGLLDKLTFLASDCHVTRNSLMLWAFSELADGRVVLPRG